MLALALVTVAFRPISDPTLDVIAKESVQRTIARYPKEKISSEELGVAIAKINRQNSTLEVGDYRGDEPMYPASVVKLFYLAYAEHLRQAGKVKSEPEFERALKDMIVDSSNDATGLVLDVITGTTGGPSLGPSELKKWMNKRQAVNKWFASLGYQKVNACQKTWNEGPYGREKQGYGPNNELRNSLTPNNCRQLMASIATDKIVTAERCAAMRGLLSRRIPADGPGADDQSRSFTGKVLPKGTQLWSKAGWTSQVSHDVAYVKLPDGREFVLALFSRGHASFDALIPALAQEVLNGLEVKDLGNPE